MKLLQLLRQNIKKFTTAENFSSTRKDLSRLPFVNFTYSTVRERAVRYKVGMPLINSKVHYKTQIMQNHSSFVAQLYEHKSNGNNSAKDVQNIINE